MSKSPLTHHMDGSEANITLSCEMEIFNFLWLRYLEPLHYLGALHKSKLAPQIVIFIEKIILAWF